MKLVCILLNILPAALAARSLRRHRKLKQASDGGGIPDQYVLRFDPSVNAKAKVQTILSSNEGLTVLHTYNSVFKGACIGNITSAALQNLLDDDQIVFVEQDEIFEMDDEAEQEQSDAVEINENAVVNYNQGKQYLPPNWGLDRIDQESLPLNFEYEFGNYTGKGVTVFVLDSGIRFTHNEFSGGRAKCSKNLVKGETCEDTRGHGTHVSATIAGKYYGVAKGANLEAVKVIASDGATSYSNLIAGINHVIFRRLLSFLDRKPMVMNLSVGGKKYETLDIVASIAANLGIVVVSSAGNNGADACDYSPGSSWWTITVGSTDEDDDRSSFSNYGKCVNIFAPGNNIWSAGARSDSAFSIRSGTSMAAPHVSGAAALYIEKYPDLGARQIRRKILEDAEAGVVEQAGQFSNNRLLHIL